MQSHHTPATRSGVTLTQPAGSRCFAVPGIRCLEMQDSEQPASCACGPYELVQQTKTAAKNNNIGYSGENALARYDQTAYNTIEAQATSAGFTISSFTYLRLDSTLMQQNNLNTFESFVSTMNNL